MIQRRTDDFDGAVFIKTQFGVGMEVTPKRLVVGSLGANLIDDFLGHFLTAFTNVDVAE
ncbi:hypothetical protein D3C76_1635490 [compost metagenome]